MELTAAGCEAAFGAQLNDILSDLHQHPELSMEEVRTTRKLREILESLGLEIIDLGAKSGVLARLPGGEGAAVALRSDIDGIIQNEQTDRPDPSKRDGCMHGCGHDVHMTSLLGAAMLLSSVKETLSGDVFFLFQPAEEALTGARYLIEECGLFGKVHIDALFGLHNDPELPVGTIGVKYGPLMANKDVFNVRFIGRRGHTSTPQKNTDPIVAAAAFIQSAQTIISRNTDPFDSAVLTFCQVNAGDEFNLGVEDAFLSGDIRTLSEPTRARLLERFHEIAEDTARMYECALDYDCHRIVPRVKNAKPMYTIAKEAALATVDAAHVVEPAVHLAAEDFALYQAYVPTFFYFLGSGRPGKENAPWHDARFYADPKTPFYGAALLAQSVLAYQKSGQPED